MSEEESSNNYTCEACGKEIENEEPMIHSGNIYHKNCIKCSICRKTYNNTEHLEDYILQDSGVFLCNYHNNERKVIDQIRMMIPIKTYA